MKEFGKVNLSKNMLITLKIIIAYSNDDELYWHTIMIKICPIMIFKINGIENSLFSSPILDSFVKKHAKFHVQHI